MPGALFDDVLAGFDDEEVLFDAGAGTAGTFFMPPIVEQNYLLQELRDPERLKHRRHDGIPGPGAEHHGGSDGTNGGYTIGGVIYYGGHWNGPLTAAEMTAIGNAGYAGRLVTIDDLNGLPASID